MEHLTKSFKRLTMKTYRPTNRNASRRLNRRSARNIQLSLRRKPSAFNRKTKSKSERRKEDAMVNDVPNKETRQKQRIIDSIERRIKTELEKKGKYEQWVASGSRYGRVRTVPSGLDRFDVIYSDMNDNPVSVRDVSKNVTSEKGVRHIAVFELLATKNNVGLDD
jgi:hypothetical protein